MHWRLGLDIGTNSVGWAAIELDGDDPKPGPLLGSGVRVFPDGRNPKDKQSLAAQRRGPRSMRKRRDRYLKRRDEFMGKLIGHGLMPTDSTARKELEKRDPWVLRVRGLDEELTLHELGRALFHIQQRRGFKSNRKIDSGDDDEKGKIKSAAAKVREELELKDARTLGELLARPRIEDPLAAHDHPVRARLKGHGAKAFYDFYPTRDLIADEFYALWSAQRRFHGDALPEKAYEDLRDTLLFQRPLKPQPVGKCTLDPTEERAPRALPPQQRLRIYQEINQLQIREPGKAFRPLTLEERDILANKALTTAKLEFKTAKSLLKLSTDTRFNYENDSRRKHLDGDKTAAVLAAGKRWGKDWRSLELDEQKTIVEHLLAEQDETKLIGWLQDAYGLSPESALAVSNAPLPAGHGRLGRTATRNVLEALVSGRAEAVDPETGEVFERAVAYDEAVQLAGYEHHSDLDSKGGILKRLPYYGQVLDRHVAFGTGEPDDPLEKRIGKIANPTVHVALNELRKLVNTLIKRFGPPTEIAVELARNLPLSAKGKSDLEREQRENQEANDRRREELKKLGHPDNYENRLRLRLWEELNPQDPLDRRCPFTGEQIGIDRVFSDEVEIEHILPFSRTLDDGIANKTLCMRQANRDKGQRSPYEAFSSSPPGYDWNMISARAENMPPNKAWRFGPDAMERFENEERNFLARHLNETRYAARLARFYLKRIGADVWVTPGRLTSDLRWKWGLDSILTGHNREEAVDPEKNRNDHRHHAIDAVVVAMTDRSMLQKVATAAGQAEEKFDRRLLSELDDPWDDFRDHVRDSVLSIVVSHKPDHGVEGALHEDTAYGVIHDPETGEERLASRKPLLSLTPAEIKRIGDLGIRKELLERTDGLGKAEFQAELEAYSKEKGVRRVRVHKVEAAYEVIRHGNGHMKAVIPGENYCMDIVETPDGVWRGVGVTRFQANREKLNGGGEPAWKNKFPDACLVMRLHKNDLVKLVKDGKETVMQVVQLEPSANRVRLAEHFEGGQLEERRKQGEFAWDWGTFSKLKDRKARIVHVDPAGGVRDPGPPE